MMVLFVPKTLIVSLVLALVVSAGHVITMAPQPQDCFVINQFAFKMLTVCLIPAFKIPATLVMETVVEIHVLIIQIVCLALATKDFVNRAQLPLDLFVMALFAL